MAVATKAQVSIYETVIENAELEAKLEARQVLKAKAGGARKDYKEADDSAKAAIGELDIADGPVRVGRFVIAEKEVAGREVSFETGPSKRISIRLVGEE